ncbi:glucokinase regulatory protein-like [Diadema setosum]|uniref:glucokinase regulatory protein-like n=1 Tax=Diadema setosum TaxID=31175 RepID=UPI003B3B307F
MAFHASHVMVESKLPITERSNPKSENIDKAPPIGIVDCLHECEREIFTGWDSYQNIQDADVVDTIKRIAEKLVEVLESSDSWAVIISGCGTSGRLAFFISTKMNGLMTRMGRKPCCHYLIGGGIRALTHSVEAFEDRPGHGSKDLQELEQTLASQGCQRILFIGITCGLSAPYVAGQLDYCLGRPEQYTPVLLGFNPVSLAKNQPIKHWDQTFFSVAKRMEAVAVASQAFILNPVVGPEAITGSSRLKGGGATKLLLEACFFSAFSSISISATPTDTQDQHLVRPYAEVKLPPADVGQSMNGVQGRHGDELPSILMETYQQHWEVSHRAAREQVAEVVEMAGKSLRAGGHVYYIGQDKTGILGLIDASECPPTFGSDFDDVRGFLKGGLAAVGANYHKTSDYTSHADVLKDETSTLFFQEHIIPTIKSHDTVIFLLLTNETNFKEEMGALYHRVLSNTSHIGIVSTQAIPSSSSPWKCCKEVILPHPDEVVGEKLRRMGVARAVVEEVIQSLTEFSLKSVLNSISTGAHIAKGKVLKNLMVDLRLSNSKLFERGISIVASFVQRSNKGTEARNAVLRSIYRTNEHDKVSHKPLSSIIERAGCVEKVVPVAIILAVGECTVEEAEELLRDEPIIREVLSEMIP